MSRQYNNFSGRLSDFGFEIITTEEEFIAKKKKVKYPSLTFACPEGHQSTLKVTSLDNKLRLFCDGKIDELCVDCIEQCSSKEEQKCRERCKQLGFEFIKYDSKTRKCTYCCVCGNVSATFARNLSKTERKAQCLKCQNNSSKKTLVELKELFRSNGCELLATEYQNKNEPLKYRCECGNESTIRARDLSIGKRCAKCQPERFLATCQERYGVDNVSQLEESKQKSQETCLKKYGVSNCMQSKEIKRKAEETCLEKHGVRWGFARDRK